MSTAEPTDRVKRLLEDLDILIESYEDIDIVSTCRAARQYINDTTIAYIRMKERNQAAQQEASDLRQKLEVVQDLMQKR